MNSSIIPHKKVIIAFVYFVSLSIHPGWTDDPTTEDAPTPYMIITTGGELLNGIYADSHVQFITRTLRPLGCRCVGTLSVGDVGKDIYDALQYAAERVPFIIVTGGLGPTDADVTRKTLSEFTGIALREHPSAKESMMKRFNVEKWEEVRENLRRQTLTPVQGDYLPNSNGTAVGLLFDDGKRVVAALPGPPRELQPMVQDQLIPFLSKRFGIHSIGCSVTMRFVGIGESSLDQALHQNMTLPDDLTIASQFELGRVDFTFSLFGNSPEEKERLKSLEREFLKYVGENFYSDDGSSLEDCIAGVLANKKFSIVTAEVGSGGSIAASLSHAKNATQVYSGGYIAPSARVMSAMLGIPTDAENRDSIDQQEFVRQIARRVCERSGSPWGIAVGDEIIEENDSRFVWIALGTIQDGFSTERVSVRGYGATSHANIVNSALDLLRRKLREVKR